jgi:hypothetical protein
VSLTPRSDGRRDGAREPALLEQSERLGKEAGSQP